MGYTTIIKQDGTTSQDTATSFEDGRIWKLATGECLRILVESNHVNMAKMGADGDLIDTAYNLSAGDITSRETICINRTEELAYMIIGGSYVVNRLMIVNIADMTTISNEVIPDSDAVTPLRAIIDPTGEKIVWLGDDNKIYKMDLDGSNLLSVSVHGRAAESTFAMSTIGDAYILSSMSGAGTGTTSCFFSKIKEIEGALVSESYDLQSTGDPIYYQLNSIDSFVLNDSFYAIGWNDFGRITPKIVKIPLSSWDDKVEYAYKLLSDYGISNPCQFNASGFDNFGTFFGEKDGVMRRWQVNLDTLECTPYRWVTYPTLQEPSNDTELALVNYSGVNGNNCDTAGLITSYKGVTGSI